MPSYELEVNEEGGTVTRRIISSDHSYEVGDVFEDEGRALRVWRIEAADPPQTGRLVCGLSWGAALTDTLEEEEEEEEQEAEEVEPAIDITRGATERILGKGGSLYLWEKPLGAWFEDKASFKGPDDPRIRFDTFDVAGVRILIDSNIELPKSLTIRGALLPPLKLHIEWDSQVWGHRGEIPDWRDPPSGQDSYN